MLYFNYRTDSISLDDVDSAIKKIHIGLQTDNILEHFSEFNHWTFFRNKWFRQARRIYYGDIYEANWMDIFNCLRTPIFKKAILLL